ERVLPVLDGAELVMPWGERYPLPVPLPEASGSRRPGGSGGEEAGLETGGPGRPGGSGGSV
ncbi:MAG TPA: hypothetical protein VFQ04_01520, partial [Actinomycetes bacterium]|nr:hypothetical protein [Actinomycetes bacterium]